MSSGVLPGSMGVGAPLPIRQACRAHLARDFDAMASRRGATRLFGSALVAAKDRVFALRSL